MFNKLAIKLLRQEVSYLRSQLRDRDQTVAELLDRFVHNRQPERLVARPATTNYSIPSPSNDAFSAAMEDAERLAAESGQNTFRDSPDFE